jgi:imidazolonepropionase-like amidohydrolase
MPCRNKKPHPARLAVVCLLLVGCPRVRAAPSLIVSTAIRDVRVFDGAAVIPRATVVIQGDRVVEVGAAANVPIGADVIDGGGKTLLPGLIDAHAHVWNETHLEQAAMFGVTTVLDMGCGDPKLGARLRTRSRDAGSTIAELRFAGYAVTAPGGHCTEYGFEVPTLTEPGRAQAFVDARIAEGSDYVKIIYDDGRAYGMHFPTISKATLAAAIAATHRRGKLAMVHIGTLQDARDAIEAGADGLAHLFIDRSPDPNFGAFLASHGSFVVPTLSVLRMVTGTSTGPDIAANPLLAPYLAPAALLGLAKTFPISPNTQMSYSAAEETVRVLQAAKVPILAGTDAPNPGTTHGASLHGELMLLVKAGLTPTRALAAATTAPAGRFGLRDRGRVARGMRADLLLVRGDPTTDIRATQNIELVWKAGVRLDREAYLSRLAQARAAIDDAAGKTARAAAPSPPGIAAGLISDFEDSRLATRFGAGWAVSTDRILGGKSTSALQAVRQGAAGSKGSLLVTGEVMNGPPFAWAGVMFSPGDRPMAPADVSSKKALSFFAKGDGQTYQVLLFSEGHGYKPARQAFTAGSHWQELTFPFSAFEGMDGHDLTGIAFVGGPRPGKIRFQLDDVRLQPEKKE